MAKVYVVDIDKCNGCHNCQIVCKDEHCNQPWLPYAQAQPLTGQFWMRVNETVRGQVPVVRISYQPTFCNHCADAPCEKACDAAAFIRSDDGLLLLDPDVCTGCFACIDACPIGAIFANDEAGLAQKCTGCAHLLDNGWDVPRCVDACPTDALRFVEEAEVDLSAAETDDALAGCGPKVYYFNKPKRFIAGAVFDSAADELVIGMKIELLEDNGAVVTSVETDDFGDFKFDQIPAASYSIRIGERTYGANVTDRDLTLGDLDIA
jgi:Fe-S-cluster-containing dehydrogenase component